MMIFDIETAPLSTEELAHVMPEFKASANVKDPEKIKSQIEQKRLKWVADAALSAVTGRVVAIGVSTEDGGFEESMSLNDERSVLEWFDGILADHNSPVLVGFNSRRFDVPFLQRRMWKHGINFRSCYTTRRTAYEMHIDLMEEWQCLNRQDTISLDQLCKHFGHAGKNGSGAMFAETLAIDKAKALRYLENDIEQTRLCAKSMGL